MMPEIYKKTGKKDILLLPVFPSSSLQPKKYTCHLAPGEAQPLLASEQSPAATWKHLPLGIHLARTENPQPNTFSAPARELANK